LRAAVPAASAGGAVSKTLSIACYAVLEQQHSKLRWLQKATCRYRGYPLRRTGASGLRRTLCEFGNEMANELLTVDCRCSQQRDGTGAAACA
jgi:hypothetical protein